MTEENKGKVGFFKRILIGIKDFDKYGILASEKVGTAVKYMLTLLCIFTVIVAAVFTYQFYITLKDGVVYYNENIQDISYKDETLSINEGNEIQIQNDEAVLPYIVIHTGANQEEAHKHIETLNMYPNGIVLLGNKMIYRNEMFSQNMEYSYKDFASTYGITEFNKDNVNEFIQNINQVSLYVSFCIVMFIYLFTIYLSSTFVDVMVLAVLGFIISRIARLRMRFKANFNIGIYALTLPIILNLIYIVVHSLTGFEIEHFQWMYTTISYIYVIVAILMIKTDFIHKQIELQKILTEQEKVKEEMQRREEERKRQEEKEDTEKRDKQREKDEKQESPNEEKPKRKPRTKKGNNLGEETLAPQEIKDLPNNQ